MEQVVAIKRSILMNPEFQGVITENKDQYLKRICDKNLLIELPRDLAEVDLNHKQIIPVAILSHCDRVFSYQRTTKGFEKRLIRQRSILFGGLS